LALHFFKKALFKTQTTDYQNIFFNLTSSTVEEKLSAGFKPWDFLEWRFNTTFSSNKIRSFVEYYTDYDTSDWSSEYKSKDPRSVDIAYSPSVTGSSELSFSVLPQMRLHFISKYVGKQFFDNTMSRERMLAPYFVNNLRIDFEPETRIARHMELQILINNLFNAEYESNAYGGNWYEDGIEKTWAYFFPQAGINYMLRIRVKF